MYYVPNYASDKEFDVVMENQLGPDVDIVTERDEHESLTYVLVKMTVVEGMHPLEKLTKGFTDLIHYVTIADKEARFMPLYANQPIDPIELEAQVPDNGVALSKIVCIPWGACRVMQIGSNANHKKKKQEEI